MPLANIITTESKQNFGCDVKQGLNFSITKQGINAQIQWPVVSLSGNAMEIDDVVKVLVQIRQDNEPSHYIQRVLGTVVNPNSNIIQFSLPESIFSRAGIYSIDAGLFTTNHGTELKDFVGKPPQYIQSGYIMVERTSFATDDKNNAKLPRIDEIKNILQDYTDANTLLNESEFSNSDIIMAIMQPIQEWNETPPILRDFIFTCSSFPYHYEWTHATAAYLLKTAIHKYMRNKLITSHGGVSGDDLNRNGEYSSLYTTLINDWKEWRQRAKYAINAGQFPTSMNQSVYSYFPSDRVYTYPR